MSVPFDRSIIWRRAMNAISHTADAIGHLTTATVVGRSECFIENDLQKAIDSLIHAAKYVRAAKADAKKSARAGRGRLPLPSNGS